MSTLDRERLLAAIAAVETSSGRNNCPRFEPAYMPRGAEFTIQGRIITGNGRAFGHIVERRWDKWGLASSASYGRWQILYHTAADLGYMGHPSMLWMDSVCWRYVMQRLDLIERRGATTVEQVADAWNTGTHRDDIYPPAHYTQAVVAAYNTMNN